MSQLVTTLLENLAEPITVTGTQAKDKTANSIFISIASYRDIECYPTVIDILEKAKYPELLTIGICQQLVSSTDSIIDVRTAFKELSALEVVIENQKVAIDLCYKNEIIIASYDIYHYKWPDSGDAKTVIKILTLEANDAQGPTFARSLIEKCLYSFDEPTDYYFIIDSHMCMCESFDLLLLEQYALIKRQTKNNKVILTCYPHDFDSISASTSSSLLRNNKNKTSINKRISTRMRKPTAETIATPPTFLKFKGLFYNAETGKTTIVNDSKADAQIYTTPGLISKTLPDSKAPDAMFGIARGTKSLLNSKYSGGLKNRTVLTTNTNTSNSSDISSVITALDEKGP